MGKHLFPVNSIDATIGAAKKQDTVLRIFVHLNKSVAAWPVDPIDQGTVHAVALQNLQQHLAVGVIAHLAGMIGGQPSFGQRHRLV